MRKPDRIGMFTRGGLFALPIAGAVIPVILDISGSSSGVFTSGADLVDTLNVVGTASGIMTSGADITTENILDITGTASAIMTSGADLVTLNILDITGTASGVMTSGADLIDTLSITGTASGVMTSGADLIDTLSITGTASAIMTSGADLVANAGGGGSIADVLASACFDLDATQSDSYSGSGQTWANLVETPDDGSAQTAYDFWLGADGGSSTDDPTFNGSAGDSAANWSFDGSDFFRSKSMSNMFEDMHFTTGGAGPVWIAMAYKPLLNSTDFLFSNSNSSSQAGMHIRMLNTELYRALQSSGSATEVAVITPASTYANEDALVIFTFDSSNAGSEAWWYNTTTGTAWSNTYEPETTTTLAANLMEIGANLGAAAFDNGTLVYGFYGGTGILSDADAAILKTFLETRHNRTY